MKNIIEKLKKVLTHLENLNDLVGGKIISSEEIKEQHENLEDLAKLLQSLDNLLEENQTLDYKNPDAVDNNLMEIHRLMTSFEWHFSEIDDLNVKLFKTYKDSLSK
ncbi:hypothetical protein P8891_21280 [Bacillus atrophaeus]|uniref:hypothetical protein n=1 Tax=Bacillus atrophaeus TaxID=1452 RepID=UPI00227F732A|nr:hypothetical protein [Bacillus atrophaeus]MCY7946885.1 hypothetical protein [Bacillus atrophaeus]MCY8098201.1 hypothetical protein [Bacillus atrophaeus]MCY9170543.1 hypothetical protein [Bacillus atrophaeus]MEC0743502.1 hypothetical protein [Bacillus atrophaeus]MEC0747749.1 hypothetical protein [Bacillus atrophaeus]